VPVDFVESSLRFRDALANDGCCVDPLDHPTVENASPAVPDNWTIAAD
jgi:hypothetical protein